MIIQRAQLLLYHTQAPPELAGVRGGAEVLVVCGM